MGTTAGFRIAVDIGGTFTDFTRLDDATGEVHVEKRLTTPQAPEQGVLAGIEQLGEADPAGILARASAIIHATTLATNAVIERKGPLTGLITTAGFADVLEIGRGYRYDLYDLHIRRPKLLIERPLRRGVPERVAATGAVLEPLDEAAVRAVAADFRAAGVGAVAVCFLHSYRNPAHELRTAEILAAELPEAAVSLSHQVIAEPKEFERTSTTAVDAYIKPIMTTYLDRLETALAGHGYAEDLLVMLSSGGTATAGTAKRFPVQMLESGPAAGVEAASFFARKLGLKDLIAFDMGGTTAKLSMVEQGRAARTRSFEIHHVHRFKAGSGLPVSLPVYDLLEIGAGGGSIAHVDSLGLLQIGPESAGAEPGPACYGRGGSRPTVTDADLVLGYLSATDFLGGDFALDAEAAGRAIETDVAKPLGLSAIQAAWGIHDLVNENMAAAARVHVAERGQDPTALSMVAFGGAGPVHALGVARKLGCWQLVIPPRPGVLSAFGLLVAPISFERSVTVRSRLADVDAAALDAEVGRLQDEVVALLPEQAGAAAVGTLVLELWYEGQDHAVEVEMPVSIWREPDPAARIQAAFEASYRRLYGSIDDMPLELVTLRLRLAAEQPEVNLAWKPNGQGTRVGRRRIYLPEAGGFCDAAVHDRNSLAVGSEIEGPALIVERESTTVIGVGDRLRVHPSGSLLIELVRHGFDAPSSEPQARELEPS